MVFSPSLPDSFLRSFHTQATIQWKVSKITIFSEDGPADSQNPYQMPLSARLCASTPKWPREMDAPALFMGEKMFPEL